MGYNVYLSCKADVSSTSGNSSLKNQNKNHKIKRFEYNDLEAATCNFSDDKLLGRGSHGLVYKAILPCGRIVAVKKPSSRNINNNNNNNEHEFDNEIDILSHIHSPSFVNLVGYTTTTHRRRLLVVEFMCNGTLYDVLHNNNNNNNNNIKVPNWGRRIRLALQVGKALHTLHSQSPPVIHRDVKSANVLLDTHLNARLADFGLALRCNLHSSTPPAGTIGYLDPSYVTPHNLSTKTDVFSFGILLLEIISGRKAIDVGHSPPSILDWAIPLIRKGKHLPIFDPRILPPKDPMVRKQLAVIAAKCVRSNKDRRPSMLEIVHALHSLTKLLPLHSWNAFTNPCLMLDNVALPIALPNANITGFQCGNFGDAKLPTSFNNTRRVYSDLGFRNNLMDLMAEPDLDSDEFDQKSRASTRASNLRVTSETYGVKGRTKSVTRFNDSGGSLVQLRKSILEQKRSQSGH